MTFLVIDRKLHENNYTERRQIIAHEQKSVAEAPTNCSVLCSTNDCVPLKTQRVSFIWGRPKMTSRFFGRFLIYQLDTKTLKGRQLGLHIDHRVFFHHLCYSAKKNQFISPRFDDKYRDVIIIHQI